MSFILGNIHWFIILWVSFNLFTRNEEFEEQLVVKKSQIPVLQTRFARKTREKNKLKKYFEDIENAKAKIERVAEQVEKLQKQLPNELSDTKNLEVIKDIAEGLNIKKIFLNPGTEENKGFYMVKRYSFKATGTYLQFLIFFEKIAENDRLFNIEKLTMSKTAKKQRGRFQLINADVTIVAYRYNADHKEDTGISAIEEEFKNGVKKQ